MFVVLVSVPVILDAPLPVDPPLKPVPEGNPQLYVVPTGTIPFVLLTGATENPVPLQTVEVIAVMAGVGLIVTVTVKVPPVQPPESGVTV